MLSLQVFSLVLVWRWRGRLLLEVADVIGASVRGEVLLQDERIQRRLSRQDQQHSDSKPTPDGQPLPLEGLGAGVSLKALRASGALAQRAAR